MDKNDLIDLLRKAYKKLKAFVYYDKNQKVLNEKIAVFECKLEAFMSEMEKAINNGLENELEAIIEEADAIDYLILPKKCSDNKHSDNKENVFFNNRNKLETENYEYQFFSNFSVKVAFVGILWVMTIGKLIDDDLPSYCYANRLKQDSVTMNSNFLFAPYFHQFETWQTKAYDKAISLLDEKKNCLIITMDISKYYYSVDVNKELFDEIYRKYVAAKDENKILEALNNFVYNVIRLYKIKIWKDLSEITQFKKYVNKEQCMLPIGFAPSNILANYYLSEYDKKIVYDTNPAFYGRYVDDFILVYEYGKEINENADIEKLIDNYIEEKRIYIKEDKSNVLDNEYIFGHGNCKPPLYINDKLVRALYDYRYDHSNIDEVKHNLLNNKNVFLYLNDEDIQTLVTNYDVYNFNQTIDKFNRICDYTIDRLKLSVVLSKLRLKLSLIDSKNEAEKVKFLDKIITKKNLFLNYQSVDKLTYIYLCCLKYGLNYFDAFIEVLGSIIDGINHEYIRYSFKSYVLSSIKNVFAMFSGKNIFKVYIKIMNRLEENPYKKEDVDQLIKTIESNNYSNDDKVYGYYMESYINTKKKFSEAHMYNKLLIPMYFPLIKGFSKAFMDYSGDYIALNDFYSCIDLIVKNKDSKIDEKSFDPIFPFYIHNYEKNLLQKIAGLMDKESDPKKEGYEEFYDDKKKLWYYHIENGTHKSKLNIGIANTPNKIRLDDIFKKKVDRSIEKFNKICTIVNRAMEDNVDILVLPEAYMPVEWIIYFSKALFNKDIALITGIEHFIIDNKVYNYVASCLPGKLNGEYRTGYMIFHLKADYSPDELMLANTHNLQCVSGNTYELINYNNFYYKMIYCYEFTNYETRYNFYNDLDATFIIEYNRDVTYFDSIISSFTRDMHCYCIQVNDPFNGDNRITAPKDTHYNNIIKLSGGINDIVIVGSVDVKALRDFQENPILEQYRKRKLEDMGHFKLTPANYNCSRVRIRTNNKNPLLEKE